MATKFSIVIPVFNCAKWLKECLDSVIGQSFQDFEIVVVDDGSTDDTPYILKEYESIDSRIRSYRQVNQGPFSARKTAYQFISGEYVLHLDADDRLRFDALEILVDIFERYQSDLIFFEYTHDTSFQKSEHAFPFQECRFFSQNERYLYLNLIERTGCLNTIWSKAIRRSILETTSYPEDMNNMVMGEDQLQSLYILDNVKTAVYTPEALYFYRITEGSTVHSFRESDIKDALCIHFHMRELFSKWCLMPGVSINCDTADYRLLIKVYNIILMAERWGNQQCLKRVIIKIGNIEAFKDAWGNKNSQKNLNTAQLIVLYLAFARMTIPEALLIKLHDSIRHVLGSPTL